MLSATSRARILNVRNSTFKEGRFQQLVHGFTKGEFSDDRTWTNGDTFGGRLRSVNARNREFPNSWFQERQQLFHLTAEDTVNYNTSTVDTKVALTTGDRIKDLNSGFIFSIVGDLTTLQTDKLITELALQQIIDDIPEGDESAPPDPTTMGTIPYTLPMDCFIKATLDRYLPDAMVFAGSAPDADTQGVVYKRIAARDTEAVGGGPPLFGTATYQIVGIGPGDDYTEVATIAQKIKQAFEENPGPASNRWGSVDWIKRTGEANFPQMMKSGQKRQTLGGLYTVYARGIQPA